MSRDRLPALVVKELTDNALDAGATRDSVTVEVQRTTGRQPRIVVADNGPGLSRSDAEIGELFSIGRPMISTKRILRATRGALGNGLRVVVGAVLASGGRLWVATDGRRLEVLPNDDGSSDVRLGGKAPKRGMTVEVEFGPKLADFDDDDVLQWARQAIRLAPEDAPRGGRRGPSSPWWYASDTFHAVMRASSVTVRELVGELDGCSGPKAGGIAGAFRGRAAASLSLEQAEAVLERARGAARLVTAERLGYVGRDALGSAFVHAKGGGKFTRAAGRGSLAAEIPFTVECWARPAEAASVVACVNGTPTVGEVSALCQAWVGGQQTFRVQACGVTIDIERAGRGRTFEVWINVQCPALAWTTDGKAPTFAPLEPVLSDTVGKAIRKAKRDAPAPSPRGQSLATEIIRVAHELWIEEWKPERIVPTLRQVFYALAVLAVVTKDDRGYSMVGRTLARAREDGSFPWEAIADHLRTIRRVAAWHSVDEFLDEKRGEFRLDKWAAQPQRIELWSEKDALAAALEPMVAELEIPFMVARGYASATAKHDAVLRLRADVRPTAILYVGDFDPSGLDMSEGAERWIREQLRDSGHVTFERLAITETDFRSGVFPTLAVNSTDPRAGAYRKQYGDRLMEAEALPARDLRDRVRAAILGRRDAGLWTAALAREDELRAEVARLMNVHPPDGPSAHRRRRG